MSGDGESPYRIAPRFLVCPRCDELLEEAFDGVHACLRCAGVWVMQPTIDTTFHDPRWPLGAAAWWHRKLECPECGVAGKAQVMDASIVDDVIVDRCRGHGVWLDQGELARVLGLRSSDHELAALQKLVAPTSGFDPSARLAARSRDREAQHRAADAMRELEAAQLAERTARRLEAEAQAERELVRVRDHAERMKQLAAQHVKLAQTREDRHRAFVAQRDTVATQIYQGENARAGLEVQIAHLRDELAIVSGRIQAGHDQVASIDHQLALLHAEEP